MDDIPVVLPELLHCLRALPWHTLRALAKANGCPFNGKWTQLQAAEALTQTLGRPERLAAFFPALPAVAQAALRQLYRAGGALTHLEFTFRYGNLRPYRPWRADAPRAPWEEPAAPTEKLFYCGLVFPYDLGTPRHPLLVFVLPADYHPALASLLARAPAEAPVCSTPETASAWPEDLLTLLSYLHREQPSPLHGRWLPFWNRPSPSKKRWRSPTTPPVVSTSPAAAWSPSGWNGVAR